MREPYSPSPHPHSLSCSPCPGISLAGGVGAAARGGAAGADPCSWCSAAARGSAAGRPAGSAGVGVSRPAATARGAGGRCESGGVAPRAGLPLGPGRRFAGPVRNPLTPLTPCSPPLAPSSRLVFGASAGAAAAGPVRLLGSHHEALPQLGRLRAEQRSAGRLSASRFRHPPGGAIWLIIR